MSDASVLFSDFKESFTFSDYFIVDENGCPYEGNLEPEIQLENLPKNVIIAQVCKERFTKTTGCSIRSRTWTVG